MNVLQELTARGIKVQAVGNNIKLSGLSSLKPDDREQVIALARGSKEELLTILQWGDHAVLVEWFIREKDNLPRERFLYHKDNMCTSWWADPVPLYEKLVRLIEKGPDGINGSSAKSQLKQLYNLFGGEQ